MFFDYLIIQVCDAKVIIFIVMLAVTEIRQYGSNSMQVLRRLLDHTVKYSFLDPADRAQAGIVISSNTACVSPKNEFNGGK